MEEKERMNGNDGKKRGRMIRSCCEGKGWKERGVMKLALIGGKEWRKGRNEEKKKGRKGSCGEGKINKGGK